MKRVVLTMVLAGCAATSGGSGAADTATFRVFYPDAPAEGFRGKVGKRFSAKPAAQ